MLIRTLIVLLLLTSMYGTTGLASVAQATLDHRGSYETLEGILDSSTPISEEDRKFASYAPHPDDQLSFDEVLSSTLQINKHDRDLQWIFPPDNRVRLSPTIRSVAFLFIIHRDNSIGTCTGTFIGPRVIATAGHCLYNHPAGGWAKSILIAPGRDGSYDPLGTKLASDWYVPSGYISSSAGSTARAALDYGAIMLNSSFGASVSPLPLSALTSDTLWASDLTPMSVGYPEDKAYGTQWASLTPNLLGLTSQHLLHDLDHVAGNNGSPIVPTASWMDRDRLVGISVREIIEDGNYYNLAIRVTPSVISFYDEVCKAFGCVFTYFIEPDAPPPPPAPPTSTGAFQNTWARTDQPVAQGQANRTWMWGPAPFTGTVYEQYQESPGQQRAVQYFDKSRMEITNPNGDANSIWYVTNGLLVNELITGNMQVGDNSFIQRQPANVNVAGDADDPTGPTYATFRSVLNATPTGLGHAITQTINRGGSVSFDSALVNQGVTAAFYVPETNHTVASVFWEFMNSEGIVFTGGSNSWAPLFINPFYATGYPITEPYWATVKVGGVYQTVLIQVFERRVLTYTPGNSPGWQVEAGNVGQHYYLWRYGQLPN